MRDRTKAAEWELFSFENNDSQEMDDFPSDNATP